MNNEKTLTSYVTNADKSFRGRLCWFITQPIWWLIFPIRWLISWLTGIIAGLFFGDELGQKTRKFIYQEILTPANFITGSRFWLLIEAILLFFAGAPLARQAEILTAAIITDFIDGPTARTNNEVTALGTYMDHIGDWTVVLWTIFIALWHVTILPASLLIISLAIILILFFIYAAKFHKFYDQEASWFANASTFAAEELQTDAWGRAQFVCLCIALFGAIFVSVADDPSFWFYSLMNRIPSSYRMEGVFATLAIYIYLGGYNTGDALNFSEAQIKKFRARLKKIKNGS